MGRGELCTSCSVLYEDITQCKEQLGSYSENPKKFKDEFEPLSLNFSLTWRDIMVIHTRCCNDEEKA